jgi:hypothetical protein
MPVIQGADRRFEAGAGRHRRRWIGAGVALILLLAGMSLLLYGILSGRVARHVAPWGGWLLMLALLLLLSRLATFVTELWQEDRSTYSRQQGAIRVARELRQALGGDWATFRNVHLPDGEGLADMVVLGPPGVFVVEVRAYTGRYRYRGRRFERRGLLGWRRMMHNPGRRVKLLSRALQRHLDAVLPGETPLMPRLVWVGPGVLELDAPEVPVWFLERFDSEVALRAAPARLTPPERAALFEVLREMCSALSP